jgi:hypothetical protein
MEIKVFRPTQFADMARDYILCADGKEIATISRGETKMVNIPDSAKNIHAKIDWCSSPLLPVSAITAGSITVKNSFSHHPLKFLFLTLYYISFGKRTYLLVEDGISG